MAEITAALVKELRDRTGVGMGKCKEALVAAGGDLDQAIANLRKAGMASAVKKEGRETNEGVIKTAENGSSLAFVEVNAETDFVVKNERFQAFADEVAAEVCKTKPANLDDFLKQKLSSDPKVTIDEYRALTIQSLGENVQIRRIELFPKKEKTSYGIYSHMGGKLVTFVEIAGSDSEGALAKEIAMHVAAESPEYLTSDEVPPRVLEHERDIARAQVKGKPESIVDKIVAGKLKAFFDQVCLLNQKFVKDPSVTIQDLVSKHGDGLRVVQFLRWHVGG